MPKHDDRNTSNTQLNDNVNSSSVNDSSSQVDDDTDSYDSNSLGDLVYGANQLDGVNLEDLHFYDDDDLYGVNYRYVNNNHNQVANNNNHVNNNDPDADEGISLSDSYEQEESEDEDRVPVDDGSPDPSPPPINLNVGELQEVVSRIIVMPVSDDYEAASRALVFYKTSIRRRQDKVIFVHVVRPWVNDPPDAQPRRADEDRIPPIVQGIHPEFEVGKVFCRHFALAARDAGINADPYIHVDPYPVEGIVKAIEHHKANLVIMGSRRLGWLRRIVCGSASDFVLHNSFIPVLIVPPPR